MAAAYYTGPRNKPAAFSHRETHPLLLDLILLKEFGPEHLAWEPETLWKEVELTYGTSIAETNKNKMQAVKTIYVVDTPFEQWDVFEKVAIALDGGTPNFLQVQKPSPHLCAFALEIMAYIKSTKVSEEVYKYCAAVLMDSGAVYGSGPLEPVNGFLTRTVPKELQVKVKVAVDKGVEPSFDGSRSYDLQIAHSVSVVDFLKFQADKLKMQVKMVLQGGE